MQESCHEELFVLSLEAWSMTQLKGLVKRRKQEVKRTIYVKALREDSICRSKNK